MMTTADTNRLIDVLIIKYRRTLADHQIHLDEQLLRDLISGVVVDTDLILDGTFSLDGWEAGQAVESAKLHSVPAEVIPDLDWIVVTGMFGFELPEKKQERERAKMAADLTAQGRPFVWHGIRHGPERDAS